MSSTKTLPHTVDEAVERLLDGLTEDQKRAIAGFAEPAYPFGFGMWVRNELGLWTGNEELLESCGSATMHPDDASMVIMIALWQKLKRQRAPEER
jgi:hypothetical protein